jgi:VWFA-related protein
MARAEHPRGISLHLKVRFVGLLALWLAASAVSLRGQERPVPVVRTTTRLVQLNVLVLGKNGKPVSGLSRDDFQVLDNGSEQKLSHFSVSSSAVPHAASAISPLEVSNRPRQGGDTPPGTTVILVDELILQNRFTSEEAKAPMRSARLAVLSFLSSLQPGEQVALYALRQEGVVVIHDLTDDPAALIAAAKTLGTGLNRASIPFGNGESEAARSMRAWLEGPRLRSESGENLQRILAGEAFSAIAHHLQGVVGRKNVIWISTTFPWMVVGLDPGVMAGEVNTILPDPYTSLQAPHFANTESHYYELRDFARQLSTTNVSVYPIDAQGQFAGAVSVMPLVNGPWATMDLVASETGGRAFYQTNGIDQILREVLDQNRVTYELGYYPGDAAWDGKYHKIKVEVKRDDLRVRCRKGYFATDEPLPQDADIALREVAQSMLDWSGIGVTLNVPSNPLEWSEQGVEVKLDTREIHFRNSGGRWRAQIDMAFVQLAGDGRILANIKDHLELALQQDTYDEAAAKGWVYPKTINIKPEAEKLRVVVRDLATGAVGSVSVPVRHEKGT